MKTVNIHEAKTNLSKLIEGTSNGESFIIAKAGKPVVKVSPIKRDASKRIGLFEGLVNIPDDFDTMGQEEIEEMFYGYKEKISCKTSNVS